MQDVVLVQVLEQQAKEFLVARVRPLRNWPAFQHCRHPSQQAAVHLQAASQAQPTSRPRATSSRHKVIIGCRRSGVGTQKKVSRVWAA